MWSKPIIQAEISRYIVVTRKTFRLEGIRFLSRVEIELEDSGELNLPKQDQKQTLDHQDPQSALAAPQL